MADLIEINIQADVRPVNNLVSALGKASNAANLADKNMKDLERSIKRGLGGSVDNLLNAFSRLERAGMSLSDVQKGLAQDARMLAQANQAQINSLLGVDRATKSARDSASAFRVILEEQERSTHQANAATQQSQRAYQQLVASMNPAIAMQQRMRQTEDMLSAAVRNGAITKEQAAQTLREYSAQMTQLQLQTARSARGINQMGVVMQQTGYQVGDFLVQVQSGTNFLVAFGQQATQLAGLLTLSMNPKMIALGAALSIIIPLATAVGAVFMRTRQDAEDAASGVDKLQDSINSLDSSLQQWLTTRRAAELGITPEQLLGGEALKEAENDLRSATAELERLRAVQEAIANAPVSPEGAVMSLLFGSRAGNAEEEMEAALAKVEAAQQRLLNLRIKIGEEQSRAEAELTRESAARNEALAQTRIQLENQVRLLQLAVTYGEDSLEVERERNLQARAAFVTEQLRAGATAEQITQGLTLLRQTQDLASESERNASAWEQVMGADLSSLNAQVSMLMRLTGMAADEARRYALNMPIGVSGGDASRGARGLRPSMTNRRPNFEEDLKVHEETARAIRQVAEELSDAEKAALEYAQALDNQVISAIDGISNAWGEFVVRGFNDFKSFANAVLNSFKSMIANMIAMAAKNRIMLSLGIGGVGAGVAGGAAAGSIGGVAGGSLLTGGGILAGTGLGTALSGLSSGFMTSVYGGLAGTAGAVSGGLAVGGIGGISTAIGAIAAPLAAVAAVVAFFRKKVTELDSGLRVTTEGVDTLVESFRTLETKRFFGLSKKVSTAFEQADEETAAPIINAVADIQSSVVDMASVLGVGSDAFSDFSYQFQVSLKGLSEEQALQAIQQELAGVADAMADLVPELAEFAAEGETASQTLARLASDLSTVNSAFSNLGRTALDASAQAAAAASRLISAAGGQAQYISKTQTLVGQYLNPREQLDYFTRVLGDTFDGTVPTRSEIANIFKTGTMEDLERLYGGETIDTLNTIFQLQDQIAAEEERRREEARRAAEAAAAAQAKAAQEAARAAQEAAKAAADARAKVDEERYDLEMQLLKLQGNIVEIRRRELEAINPANRALQEMIWKLEDAKEAMEGINEIDFATLFDYQRAVAMARINTPANVGYQPAPMPMVVNGSATVSPEAIPTRTNEGTTAEDAAFIRQSLVEMIKYTKRTSDTLRKFDTDGLPPERT